MLLARRSDPAAHATRVSPRLAPLRPAATHAGKRGLGAHGSKPPAQNPPRALREAGSEMKAGVHANKQPNRSQSQRARTRVARS